MSDAKPSVVLVDDHELAREGLRLALEQRGFNVCATVATGEEGIEAVRKAEPDLVLLDIRLGSGIDGLSAAAAINGLGLRTRVVMLSLHDDADYVRSALRAGAKGYVLKDATLDELCTEVRLVLAGGTAVPAALLSSLLLRQEQESDDTVLIGRLTDRERSVLELVADGLTNKAIARELGISPATVKAHVERLLSKLGVSDRTQAAVMMARWTERSQ